MNPADANTVKVMVAILCGLSLLLGQMFPASAAGVCPAPVKANCGCGGKMACGAEKSPSSAPVSAPPVRAGSENQILPFVPATVFWVLSAAGTMPNCPANHLVSPHAAAPIFVRHCVRLI